MCGDFHTSATEMVEVREYQNNVSNTLTWTKLEITQAYTIQKNA